MLMLYYVRCIYVRVRYIHIAIATVKTSEIDFIDICSDRGVRGKNIILIYILYFLLLPGAS